MFTRLALSSKSFTISKLLLVVLVVLGISKLLGPIYGPIVIFIILPILVSPMVPSKYLLQRVAIAAVLFVGLSPVFLIFRGIFAKSPLTNWDLQIYSACFFLSFLLVNLISKKHRILDSYSSSFINKRYLVAGFFGLIFVLLIEILLQVKSIGHAVSWIASGDSKNHLVNGVDIIRYGYLDPVLFLTQPVSSPTYLALNLSQGNSNLTSQSDLLSFQMQSYAYVWVLLIGLIGLIFAATLEVAWNQIKNTDRVIPIHLIGAVSLIPTFSVVLGPALFDGFFTAVFGISSVAVLITWFIEIYQKSRLSTGQLIIGLFLFFSSLMAWMFVIPLTFAVFFFGIRANLKNLKQNRVFIESILLVALFCIAAFIHFSSHGQSFIFKAKSALTASGAVSATDPLLYFVAIFALIIISALLSETNKKFSESLTLISFLSLASLFGFKYFSNLSINGWNYYLIKYQWIMFASLLPIIFSLLLINIFLKIENSAPKKYLISSLVLISIFFASETMVSSNRIWQKIWKGWENPRSITINKVLEQDIDRNNPTLFFHYGYAGDARLANFWLTAFAVPLEPIKGWNYTIDTAGDPIQLCDVNAYYPKVRVVTSDSNLENELNKLCSAEEFIIILEPSPI